jgi:hypothetical protein
VGWELEPSLRIAEQIKARETPVAVASSSLRLSCQELSRPLLGKGFLAGKKFQSPIRLIFGN